MGIADRLSALGRGAAQGATAGWGDEGFAKIMDYLPRPDDGTGIPREYAAGSAEKDYLNTARGADADAAQKYPLNYGAGALLGAAPAAIASAPLGVGGAVGLGATQAAGASENTGRALAKDAIRGGALGGIFSTAGNIASAGAPAAKAAFEKLRQGPPGGLAPAMATAEAAPVARAAAAPELGGAQINKMAPKLPPRPTTADLAEVMPETAEQRAIRAIEGRPSVPPEMPTRLPKPAKTPSFTEEELDLAEKRLRQTEASGQKRLEAKFQNAQNPPKATVRPGKKAKAPKEQTGLALVEKQAPAPRPELTAANKPLVGPKQLSDDRILELARQQREAAGPIAPQGARGLTPEQFEAGKQQLRDQFKKTAGGGNVVSLDDGAIQVADNPFVAGRVREFQQHAKAAADAGDADAAEYFKNQIEDLLAAGGK